MRVNISVPAFNTTLIPYVRVMQFKITILALLLFAQPALAEKQWFKGNTHTHTLWSDGDDFPDMIPDWYKERGYDFLVLSDHNILSRGERWMKVADIKKRGEGVGEPALGKYLTRFGADWVELRGEA